jgi:uncharacterized membrane protein
MASVISRVLGAISIPCLLLGLLFFTASPTPSLLPREPVVQGVLGGLVTALGYLIGRTVELLWRAIDMPRPTGRLASALTWIAAVAVGAAFLAVLGRSLSWQNDLRLRMGMPEADALNLATITGAAVATFAAASALGSLVGALFRVIRARLYRVMPRRRANVLGAVAVGLILFVVTREGILDRVVAGLDESYEAAQALFEDAPPPPDNPRKVGGPGSLIDWAAIGKPGRDFITSGPDAAAISDFTGRPALDAGGREISVTKTAAGRRFIDLSPDTLDMVRYYMRNLACAYPSSDNLGHRTP